LTIWPSLNSTLMSWPVICVFTFTVWSGTTVPSARITTGTSPLVAVAIPTGVGAPAPNLPAPCFGAGVVPVCEIYQPAATTMARPKPIPSRVRSRFIGKSLCPQTRRR
jgi:hypothetical protein